MPIELKPIYLRTDSLHWSLLHIMRYGDTDIFPVPFEFEAYQSIFPEILKYLTSINLTEHEVNASIKLMVPKSSSGFRAATQLDPLDCLLYTAFVYEMSKEIEDYRIDVKRKIACSYRLDIQPNGQFFQKDNGWNDYHSNSEKLLEDKNCSFVLCADISDFYNQISHHRIQNALSSAKIDENQTRVFERFLNNINALQHSRGIPVGPAASILIAEICLTDVDNFLLRKGYNHTRYVDDFRIFCKSEQDAIQALHDLSDYLYKVHRLSLQSNKTRIYSKNDFRRIELNDPKELEQKAVQERISEFIINLDLPPYMSTEDITITNEEEAEFVRMSLKDMIKSLVNSDYLNIGLARYVLRRATLLKSRVIMPALLDNIQKFVPVMRDVAIYLLKNHDKSRPEQIGEVLCYLLQDSDYKNIPFVQYWVLYLMAQKAEFCDILKAINFAEKAYKPISERMLPLIAKNYNIIDWVRSQKEIWSNYSPWAQRAIIWASSILPKDERNHWLKPIINSPIPNISLLAKATKVKNG